MIGRRVAALVAAVVAVLTITTTGAGASVCTATDSQVDNLYRAALGRDADQGGAAYWTARIWDGASIDDVRWSFANSTEALALDDGAWLDRLYSTALGRTADTGGRAYWLDVLQTRGRADVLGWFVDSPEFQSRWSTGESCHGQGPIPGARYWTAPGGIHVLHLDGGTDATATFGHATPDQVGLPVTVNGSWFAGSHTFDGVSRYADGSTSGATSGDHRSRVLNLDGFSIDRSGNGGQAIAGKALVSGFAPADHLADTLDPTFTRRNPRTAVGITTAGDVLLVVVDGRQAHAPGMTGSETAQLLISLGAETAVMLDGGGSTQLSIHGEIVNRPSNGRRAVANQLSFG